MDRKSLLLGVLLGIIGGLLSSIISGSLIAIIQLVQVNIVILSGILFLMFLDASLALILFIRWVIKNLVL